MSTKVAIIGTTGWGTTLGIKLSTTGSEVILWARTEEEAAKLNTDRENIVHLPSVYFPETLRASSSPTEALERADLAVLAVPAQTMRDNLRLIGQYIRDSTLLLSISKGIEIETTKRMSEVIIENLGDSFTSRTAILSGPNFAKEIAQDLPTATVIASANMESASRIQHIISSPNFRAYTNEDIVGVELGGALKNVMALSVGMSDGLGFGDNTRAALITRGLAEMARLGVAAGANPLTFAGLAGMGDLVATCTSQLSRNRFVGQELAKGRPLEEILSSMSGIAEGVDTTIAALRLAKKLEVEMPIAEQVYRVLFDGLSVKEAAPALMERELKHELNVDTIGRGDS